MVNRRRILGAAALAAGWLTLPPRLAWSLTRDKPDHMLARRLVEVFRRRQSALAIGQAYLRGVAEAPRFENLLQSVVAGLETPASELRRTQRLALRQALQACVRQDFAENRTVRIDGWVLSQTEAQLCGLAALVLPV